MRIYIRVRRRKRFIRLRSRLRFFALKVLCGRRTVSMERVEFGGAIKAHGSSIVVQTHSNEEKAFFRFVLSQASNLPSESGLEELPFTGSRLLIKKVKIPCNQV